MRDICGRNMVYSYSTEAVQIRRERTGVMNKDVRLSWRIQVALITCLMMLVITVTPPVTGVASAQTTGTPSAEEGGSWSEEIPRMLQAGKYREGVVFAGIDLRQVKDIEDVSEDAEEIMTVDARAAEAAAGDPEAIAEAEAVAEGGEEAAAAEGGKTVEAEGGKKTAAAQEDCVSITCIQRDDMTTEQILKELAKDDSVIFAEPDYIIEEENDDAAQAAGGGTDSAAGSGTDNTATGTATTGTDSAATTGTDPGQTPGGVALQEASSIADLRPFQWSSSDSASLHAKGDPDGMSINVPGFFDEEGSNMDEEVVVAVIDQPVDYTNPDLAPVAYTFTDAEQQTLGCDVHGYNATWQSTDGKLSYWPKGDHGTHCAGIIGAAWDGHGISGVGSKVKLISVQNCLGDGKTSLINVLRGMAFIKRANEECHANIRITNNSWGLNQSSRALDAAVRELGEEQGIISVFAAGNDSSNADEMDNVSDLLINNPYAVIVAATDPGGELAAYSNFSDRLVTLGAPGSGILSTIQSTRECDSAIYIPDATPGTNKLFEGFEDGEPSISINLVDDDMQPVGEPTITGKEGLGYAGEHALRIDLDPDKNPSTIRMDLGDVYGKGVRSGDYLGFAFGQEGTGVIGRTFSYYDDSTHKWVQFTSENTNFYSENDCFGNIWISLPQGADLKDLRIAFKYDAYDDYTDAMYMDSVGIGTQRVPYRMMNGTSMATPAVSGGAAVLASRYPEATGAELANLVTSSVRQLPALAGKTQTGGILDLAVNASPDGTTPAARQPGPDITSASLDGLTLTVEGRNFGGEAGSATVKRPTPGTAGKSQSASVSSWSDKKVVLQLKEKLQGIGQVSLRSKGNGKQDSYTWFVSRSDCVYSEDLPLNKGTRKPFLFDGEGDREASGPLQALKGKLYFLPATVKVEVEPAHRQLMVYDQAEKTWEALEELPVWLEKPSAAVHDGKLIVKGAVMEVASAGGEEVPSSAENPQAAVYAYDPGKDSWTACSAENVTPDDTLVAAGENLLLVGHMPAETGGNASVRTYDPASGGGEKVADFSGSPKNPSAAVSGDVLYMYNKEQYCLESVDLKAGTGGQSQRYDLPGYVGQAPRDETSNDTISKRNGVLVPVSSGVLFLGPAAADGSSDTFLLKTGENSLASCPRRISEDSLLNLTAAADGDQIYVIASAMVEPDGRLFRTDSLENITKKPSVDPTPIPAPAQVVDNPMVARGKTVKLKAKKLRKKSVKVKPSKAYSITGAKGKLTFKKVKVNKKKYRKKFLVNKSTGRITVKKGVRKGVYQVTVRIHAAGDEHHAPKIVKVKVRIRVR